MEKKRNGAERKKWTKRGGRGDLYDNFSDGITDGNELLLVALNSVSNSVGN